jgi:hypothetical protein
MSAIGNKKGEITCACQLGGECEGNFSHPSMVCCSYSSDPQTKVIWDLKEEIKKLKEEAEGTLVLVQLLQKMKEENDEMNEELWGEAK